MSYHTRFRGQIQITPPLRWAQIKDSRFMPELAKQGVNGRDCKFVIETFSRDTDEGRLQITQAVGLVSTWEDEASGYHMVEHIQEAIDAFPDHEFSGQFDCEGEESGDIWRLEITHDRQAVDVRPLIIWPGDLSKAPDGLGAVIEGVVRDYFDMKSTPETGAAFRLIGDLKSSIQIYLFTIGKEAGR